VTPRPGSAAQRQQAAPGPAVPAVRCAGLRYSFGTHRAVDGVDLLIAAGETFGLLGPNGAGKTTTIRMLTTLLKPDEGTVAVFGVDAAAQPMLVRRLIGYVPQLLSADASLTGRENVELFARLFDVPRRVRGQQVDQALSAMGLAEAAQRLVKTYSGGMIRRLELAQALVNAPRLLVLDEPTVGLTALPAGQPPSAPRHRPVSHSRHAQRTAPGPRIRPASMVDMSRRSASRPAAARMTPSGAAPVRPGQPHWLRRRARPAAGSRPRRPPRGP